MALSQNSPQIIGKAHAVNKPKEECEKIIDLDILFANTFFLSKKIGDCSNKNSKWDEELDQ